MCSSDLATPPAPAGRFGPLLQASRRSDRLAGFLGNLLNQTATTHGFRIFSARRTEQAAMAALEREIRAQPPADVACLFAEVAGCRDELLSSPDVSPATKHACRRLLDRLSAICRDQMPQLQQDLAGTAFDESGRFNSQINFPMARFMEGARRNDSTVTASRADRQQLARATQTFQMIFAAAAAAKPISVLTDQTVADQMAMPLGPEDRIELNVAGEVRPVVAEDQFFKDINRTRFILLGADGEAQRIDYLRPCAIDAPIEPSEADEEAAEEAPRMSKGEFGQAVFDRITAGRTAQFEALTRVCHQAIHAPVTQATQRADSPFTLEDGTPVTLLTKSADLLYTLRALPGGVVELDALITYKNLTVAPHYESTNLERSLQASAESECGSSVRLRISPNGVVTQVGALTWSNIAPAQAEAA